MGTPSEPLPARLVAGLLAGAEAGFERARALLEGSFGPVDLASPILPFPESRYYDDEIGAPVLRRFLSFSRPAAPGDLAAVKLETNRLELLLAAEAGRGVLRPVNIDPGLVDPARLVLATTKANPHRVYLRDGIYAEVTLVYRARSWQALPWTYPDYASGRYFPFLEEAREALLRARREGAGQGDDASDRGRRPASR